LRFLTGQPETLTVLRKICRRRNIQVEVSQVMLKAHHFMTSFLVTPDLFVAWIRLASWILACRWWPSPLQLLLLATPGRYIYDTIGIPGALATNQKTQLASCSVYVQTNTSLSREITSMLLFFPSLRENGCRRRHISIFQSFDIRSQTTKNY
jgi:hypothetical protein